MNKIGISTCGFPLTEEYFSALAESEIGAVKDLPRGHLGNSTEEVL